MNDQVRAGVISLAQSLFPVLVLLNVVELDDTQIAAIMLFISNVVTVLALVFKAKPSAP